MAPSRPPKLDLASVLSSPPSSNHPTSSVQQQHPSSLSFLTSGSASRSTLDSLCLSWRERGFCGNESIKLRGLVYELASSGEEPAGTSNALEVGKDARQNLPIGVVNPLAAGLRAKSGEPPALPEPGSTSVPAHLSLNFSLPTIRSEADLSEVNKWVEIIKAARERQNTLEMALVTSDGSREQEGEAERVREKVEEILGKAHSDSAAARQEKEGSDESGGYIVFDSFASPPLHINSTSLPRSQELQDWAAFVGRLALHPQTYIKLSPLVFPSSLSNPLTTPPSTRAADHSSSLVQSAAEVLSSASASAQGDLLLPAREKSEEVQSRVRIFLEVLIEAFGTERVFWACHLNALGPSLATASTDGTKEAEEAVKEWYETVRSGLYAMGLGRRGELDGIFAE
ncbi:hypothetical protein BCV69DRAFT_66478 [Microstroma glucosiphilum]|uniref:Uncharacterized protein n=1 Tax=Pseudomicrostroma glucosiphilum TaxID=1684307 RepID=A0A316U128_9BASI|nr:hypothetical protein BCV69DRAFT_66478 [Pseudomicrostroma glucosiphilum]PWN18568.1 hypothetical protein BCV69DRAFT_66478 [Pseudomicrostroma glucosiphilum]